MQKKEEKLIKIDEIIERAKELGVDFGKGDPKNRLRYLTKIGLLPHCQRKVFEKGLPEGAYPEWVIDRLLEIDRYIKSGKNIQEIKEQIFSKTEKDYSFLPNLFKILKIVLPTTFVFSILFFSFPKAKQFLVGQLFTPKLKKEEKTTPTFFKKAEFLSPFFTINAETIIKKSLEVREKIKASTFSFLKNAFLAEILPDNLTANRQYLLPDQSGTICLNTGNCFGLFDEVTSKGGTKNRLAKFMDKKLIGDSSIEDLFSGTSITIDEKGNVGIGKDSPKSKLDVLGDLLVEGKIQATGDICTDEAGGKCLSKMITWFFGGGGGISGSGQAGYLPIWLAGNRLGQSILFQNGNEISISGILTLAKTSAPSETSGFGKIFVGSDGKLYFKDEIGNLHDLTKKWVEGAGTVGEIAFWSASTTLSSDGDLFWDFANKRLGIGTKTPTQKVDVVGTIRMTGFQLPTGAQAGYVLTSLDTSGSAVWMPAPSGSLPSGFFGQTLRHDGNGWVPTYFLYNDGTAIGIGTTSTLATLTVAGSGFFSGPLTIETNSLPQLILKYNNDNYLNFFITSTSSEIFSSSTLAFNSLTGELKFFDTSIKKGDKILRASIPIFKFPLPAETASTSFVAVSRQISTSTLNSILPPQLPGAQRKFAILLNFADNIPTNASSSWQIDFQNQTDINFQFPGQNLPNLDEGISHLKDDLTNLLNDNWTLKVKVDNPSHKIRIFNAFLIVYDQIQ
jgi:hypothetical protein